jgi:hypothetical protein
LNSTRLALDGRIVSELVFASKLDDPATGSGKPASPGSAASQAIAGFQLALTFASREGSLGWNDGRGKFICDSPARKGGGKGGAG